MATLADRPMELRHLRYFTAIADARGFTRAAEQLRLSQPALSRQVRDLENEVGCRLFERTAQGVRLTASGVRLLHGARKLLTASEALLAEARGHAGATESRHLRMAHFGPLCAQHISGYLRRMVRRFPKLRLHIEEDIPSAALKRVRAGTLDAAIAGLPDKGSLRGLETREVWAPPHEILVAADHALAKRRRIRIEDLRGERWGLWDEKVCPGFARPAIQACRQAGFRLRAVAVADSLATIFVHVAENGYISYAPRFARQIAPPGVVFLPLEPAMALRIPVHLVWRTGSPHHEALCWLAEAMRPLVRA